MNGLRAHILEARCDACGEVVPLKKLEGERLTPAELLTRLGDELEAAGHLCPKRAEADRG